VQQRGARRKNECRAAGIHRPAVALVARRFEFKLCAKPGPVHPLLCGRSFVFYQSHVAGISVRV
jgi:hypothetical protein